MRRVLFPLIIGLGGAAILLSLGIWQVQRLAWKEGVIADIEARIVADPVALPDAPESAADAYLPVIEAGALQDKFLRVLVSQKQSGAAYRIIAPFEMEDRRVMVDLGVIPAERTDFSLAVQPLTVIGNLQWPDEIDSFTPEPDRQNNIWFARDVPAMAQALGTEPVLIVAKAVAPNVPVVSPMPVDTSRIPNNHLQYAVTWFSLAALWLAMTLFFVLRGRKGQN